MARCFVQDMTDAVAAAALAKPQDWEYVPPAPGEPTSKLTIGTDGKCLLMWEDGWRETMVETIGLYDEGERQRAIYLSATPEYGKASFLGRMDREIERVKASHPHARYVGLADGAKGDRDECHEDRACPKNKSVFRPELLHFSPEDRSSVMGAEGMSEAVVRQCQCPACLQKEERPNKSLPGRMNLLLTRLDEQLRRWYVAVESARVGHDGDPALSRITGMNVETIRRGRSERDDSLRGRPADRVRLPGGGPPPAEKKPRRPQSS